MHHLFQCPGAGVMKLMSSIPTWKILWTAVLKQDKRKCSYTEAKLWEQNILWISWFCCSSELLCSVWQCITLPLGRLEIWNWFSRIKFKCLTWAVLLLAVPSFIQSVSPAHVSFMLSWAWLMRPVYHSPGAWSPIEKRLLLKESLKSIIFLTTSVATVPT